MCAMLLTFLKCFYFSLLLIGIEYIAEILVKNCVLCVLKMGWNNISDDGMFTISGALKDNTSLVELSLVMCKISPKGMHEYYCYYYSSCIEIYI